MSNILSERIKQLCENRKMIQLKLAAVLDIDIASYCKIGKGEHHTCKKQVPIIAELLQSDRAIFLTLRLAQQIASMLADKVSSTIKKNINNDMLNAEIYKQYGYITQSFEYCKTDDIKEYE
ncbi:MAG: hypothetical protein LBH04_08055 [Tannerellaceae bacterium]|jgi:hypothetical protein|nr:hypothetical protein [Tannerellaceae bacterium]